MTLALPGRFTSRSPEETEEIGAALAARLRPGDVVLLEGEMGTGKTTFVRGAAHALGVTGRVTSPTFTLARRLPGRVPVHHLDLHRLVRLGPEDEGVLADHLTADAVAFLEWPGAARDLLPTPAWTVTLSHDREHQRGVTVARC